MPLPPAHRVQACELCAAAKPATATMPMAQSAIVLSVVEHRLLSGRNPIGLTPMRGRPPGMLATQGGGLSQPVVVAQRCLHIPSSAPASPVLGSASRPGAIPHLSHHPGSPLAKRGDESRRETMPAAAVLDKCRIGARFGTMI